MGNENNEGNTITRVANVSSCKCLPVNIHTVKWIVRMMIVQDNPSKLVTACHPKLSADILRYIAQQRDNASFEDPFAIPNST